MANVSKVIPDGIVTLGDVDPNILGQAIDKIHDSKHESLTIFTWGHYKRNFRYKTFRDVFAVPEGVNDIKSVIGWLNPPLRNNNFEGVKHANEDLLEAFTSFPFVVLEPDFVPPKNFMDLFIEEGKINLPFPIVTILLPVARNPGEGFDSISPVFLAQANDSSINVHVIMGKTVESVLKRPHIATVNLCVRENPANHTLGVYPAFPVSQTGWLSDENYHWVLDKALMAIYMLTYHTGEVLMAKPSTRDVEVNRKKLRKGKKPLIEFKLISITGKETHKPSVPHGTHASPKQHWRRGHWRNYKSGKRAWVEPMLVGDEANGKIVKDYAIGNYRDSGSHAIIRQ